MQVFAHVYIRVRVWLCARAQRWKDECGIAQGSAVMHLGINCESHDASQKNLGSKQKTRGGGVCGGRWVCGWCDSSVAMHTANAAR